MKVNWVALLIFIVLVSTAIVTIHETLPPSPLPVNASSSEFSAERAFKHILVVADQPRPTGSHANTAAGEYILTMLKDLGLDTETQQGSDFENIMGKIAGTRSPDAVLLTAHYDSVAESPGATDDGSGVAVLLETARALVSDKPMLNTVMFLFTDNEEGGLIGANAFIADHPWAREVRIVIGFDAGGLSGPGILSSTSADNGWLIRHLAKADPYVTGSSAINALADSGTDFGHAFKTSGFRGYAFDLYWDRRIHTAEDNIENVNLSSLQHQGYHALALASYFSNLTPLVDPKEPNRIYFPALRLLIVTYSSIWAIPLAIAIGGIFIVVLIYGIRRKILSWYGIGFGAFVVSIGLIIAPLSSIFLGERIPGMPIRYTGRSLDQPHEVSAAVLLAVTFIICWYFLSSRLKHTSLPDLTLGALVPMLIGMVGTSIIFPELSFSLTWPLLISLLACANWFYWGSRQEKSNLVILGTLFSGMMAIVILVPTILLGLFDQPTLTLLLLGTLCAFLVPQIHLVLGRTITI